jgi:hypothetical protein
MPDALEAPMPSYTAPVNDTLFVFIRPVVVRDPAFRDLLYLSKTDIEAAKLRQRDYPWNRLKLLHMAPSHEEN